MEEDRREGLAVPAGSTESFVGGLALFGTAGCTVGMVDAQHLVSYTEARCCPDTGTGVEVGAVDVAVDGTEVVAVAVAAAARAALDTDGVAEEYAQLPGHGVVATLGPETCAACAGSNAPAEGR